MLLVQLEGKGYFDAMMMQGRAVNNGDFIQGGVGLVGSFEKLDKDFTYLECFRSNYATVVDTGHSRLSNATFVWVPPETDKGDIRFMYDSFNQPCFLHYNIKNDIKSRFVRN